MYENHLPNIGKIELNQGKYFLKKKENINIDYAKVRILSKSDVIRFIDKTSISTYYCMVEV